MAKYRKYFSNLVIFIIHKFQTSQHQKYKGYVYKNVFQGRIQFDNVPTYVIESTQPYAGKIDTKRYHSFIYRNKDMHNPEEMSFGKAEAKGILNK